MLPLRRLLAVAVIAALPACFHATIETGRPASAEVITKSFAAGWIYGLVPPSAVSTASQCPNGVAKVETQLSFVNQLVSLLTFGIYTPMEIKVTCAGRGSASAGALAPDLALSQGASVAEIVAAMGLAADQTVLLERPVFVSFEAPSAHRHEPPVAPKPDKQLRGSR